MTKRDVLRLDALLTAALRAVARGDMVEIERLDARSRPLFKEISKMRHGQTRERVGRR